MPAAILQRNQSITLAAGASTTITHGLHDTSNNGYTPNRILPDRATTIAVVSVSSTSVVFRNDGFAAETATFLIQYDHTIQQASTTTSTLLWQGSGTNTGAIQPFRFTSPGGSSDFMVTMPVAMPSDTYTVNGSLASAAAIVGMQFPDTAVGDRTTTQFRVVTSAPLVAGDMIDFIVTPR